MLDILIKNSSIVDGTGAAPFFADIGVANGRIAVVAEGIGQEAIRTLDARGLHVAPGFIDPHSHSDFSLLIDPRAQSKIRQGVTTEVIGNCGFSAAPLFGSAVKEAQALPFNLGADITWNTVEEYLELLRQLGTAVNVVPLVGHNSVRGSVLGYGDTQPESSQQHEMERLVEEAMIQGSRGLSTGLWYGPGRYAQTEEVIGLARVTSRHGGIYASHLRSEADVLLDAVSEAIHIGEQADIRVEISHLKLLGHRNWHYVDRLIPMLEGAEASGVCLRCDQYPYTACLTWLSVILPPWVTAGGSEIMVERLSHPSVRAELRRDWEKNRAEWEDRIGMSAWSDVLITGCLAQPEAEGNTVAEIAESEGKDPLEATFDLISIGKGAVFCAIFSMSAETVRLLMQLPIVTIGSDGWSLSPDGVLGQSKTHPRSYGTFPRVLGRYVREEKVLSLEAAVKKMTSLTATHFGLMDRGVVREGAWADLVLFDAQCVIDKATYAEPHKYPAGIPYVLVNGQVVIDQGEHTGILPGQLL